MKKKNNELRVPTLSKSLLNDVLKTCYYLITSNNYIFKVLTHVFMNFYTWVFNIYLLSM